MTVQLPTRKQSRASLEIGPLNARVMLAGMPKSGKSTLAAGWAPDKTLIIDTQRGTTLLPGEHYVEHVSSWSAFEEVVKALTTPGHQFETVVIDMVDDIWNFVDQHCAGRGQVLASATDDYSRSIKSAEGTFRRTIGQLLATDLGVWFLTHTKAVQDGDVTRYVAKLDAKVLTYVQGAVQFIFLAETLGAGRKLHTAPSAKFEAGGRVALPDPMDLDARALYDAMAAGLAAGTSNGNGNGGAK
ncbi:MAG TPA: AAA family ATPase [Solirubrobacteraceae bacterium]|nr:AAA family ATPase [Solirubrobacteraceae bacterium]